jgi:hypothetical protein
LKKNDFVAVGSNHGHFGFSVHILVTGPEGWVLLRADATADHWIQNRLLDFGFEHLKKAYGDSRTTAEMPWWAATLVAGIAPLWLYRRQRRRRRKGFPIEPVVANSKELTPVQTG